MEYNNQPVILAYYKNTELKGFYSDDIGTITQIAPKIYELSDLPSIEEKIEMRCKMIRSNYENILHNPLSYMKEWNEFEIRIMSCPDYVGLMYPIEQMNRLIKVMRENTHTEYISLEVLKFKINE